MMKKNRFPYLHILCLLAGWIMVCSTSGQSFSPDIRLNQTGFYTDESKLAVLVNGDSGIFTISSPDLTRVYFTGTLSGSHKSSYSPTSTRIADFSGLNQVGVYVVNIPGKGYSYPFAIRQHVYAGLAAGLLKSYYYQRMSVPLAFPFAGKWSRPAGHPDNQVLIHPSAASAGRPEGSVISCQGGWYDAGDYNKYIVNSGITVGTMLSLYEDYPDFCKSVKVQIPESENALPDLLDENLWNIRWMLTMQDPGDGGVYHKVTNPGFDAFVAPAEARAPRYVVQKSTAATLDFASVMAQASRIFRKFDVLLPGLADSCLAASEKAWDWAMKNPKVYYNQHEMNTRYKPEIFTGEYGDGELSDEFIWAACELMVTTGKETYRKAVNLIPDEQMPVPEWANVRLLGYYTLFRFEKQLPGSMAMEVKQLKSRMLNLGDQLTDGMELSSYVAPMCVSAKNFIWGSNAVAANQGIALLVAYRISGDKKYLSGALNNLDYLLGRNATGYSYVTGFGSKTPMNPHHRPSASDGVLEPVPGLLTGGPNPGKQDGCVYASSVPDEAYTDVLPSYASNEVAINWNAPMVYLVWALEATQDKK